MLFCLNWRTVEFLLHTEIGAVLYGYVACFLNVSFDVLSVTCRLRSLRLPFKILFYLVPHFVFPFMSLYTLYLGDIRRLSWNDTCVTLKMIPSQPPNEHFCHSMTSGVCPRPQNKRKHVSNLKTYITIYIY